MTGIELPVRVEELRGGNVRLVDTKGETLDPYDLVAILNASPPRAFSSLTLAEFHRIIAEDIADPESMVGDARTLLRRLQAFAAPTPAELAKKLNASDLLNAHADAMAFARAKVDPASPSGLQLYGEQMRSSIVRLMSEGGAA